MMIQYVAKNKKRCSFLFQLYERLAIMLIKTEIICSVY